MPKVYKKQGIGSIFSTALAAAGVRLAMRESQPKNENMLKKCFRKGCDNSRGERGLYCSAECFRIDEA
jgi:hypothetical protein